MLLKALQHQQRQQWQRWPLLTLLLWFVHRFGMCVVDAMRCAVVEVVVSCVTVIAGACCVRLRSVRIVLVI